MKIVNEFFVSGIYNIDSIYGSSNSAIHIYIYIYRLQNYIYIYNNVHSLESMIKIMR